MLTRHYLCVALVIGVAYLAGCAPNPYAKAQKHYYDCEPALAEEVLAPLAQEEQAKDGKMKNLYLWDLGVYRFSQGNYEGAITCFKESVQDKEEIHDGGETAKAVLTNAASQKYVGDPVEVSVAYLYLGLAFYMNGDYENALVAFRRSIEEDLSKDDSRQGDMAVTNYILAEAFWRVGKYDDAAVAYRRALEHSADLVPAYVGLYHAMRALGKTADEQRILGEIEKRVDEDYFEAVTDSTGAQGISLVLFTGHPSKVERVSAFRKRKEINQEVPSWQMSCGIAGNQDIHLFLADNMHNHMTDQGGLSDELRQQTTRAVAGTVMKQIPFVGLFAPSTEADIRYWPTMPGHVYIGYYSAEVGLHQLSLRACGKDGVPIPERTWSWDGIEVEAGKRELVIVNGCYTLSKPVN
jgi:tetratricopeptide (TPR) repeat protein